MQISQHAPTRTKPQQASAQARPAADATARMAMLLLGSFVLVLLGIVLGIGALLVHDKQRELARQQTELGSLAHALEEHVARTFGQVDSGMQFLARLQENEVRIAPESLGTLSTYTHHWLKSAPHAAALSIRDDHGRPLLQVQQAWLRSVANAPLATNSAQQNWRNKAGSPMRIGQAIQLRTQHGQEWFIPVEQDIFGIGGKRIGITDALISTRYFDQFYREIHFSPHDTISLLSDDGRLLLRYPMHDALMGTDPSALASAGSQAPSVTVSRRLSQYPMLVGIARPQTQALANYYDMRQRVMVGGGLLIFLLAVTTWIVFRDTRQRERDRAELSQINASLEARVSRRTAELEQSNRDLVGFSYSISHDLRTPLRAINGFAHALIEDAGDRLDAQGIDHLAHISRASVRMGDLIDELLNLANVARRPLNVKPIELSAMLSDLFDELRITDPERVVNFSLQPNMRAEGDEALLRNALSNLLQNAWKFTRGQNPAEISITAHATPECMNYSVADNGVGFDMAHAKRLFQPFQQLHNDQSFGGTGIGLASVRRIIERHGGQIWAESRPGEGARFIFTLPHHVAVVRRRRRDTARPQT